MATDLRGHTVPAPGEFIDFNAINQLSATINATKTVANMVEAQQYLEALTAASLPTVGLTIFNQADNRYYGRIGGKWERFSTSYYSPVEIPRRSGISGTLTASFDGLRVIVEGQVSFSAFTAGQVKIIGDLPASIPNPAGYNRAGTANSGTNQPLVFRIGTGGSLELINRAASADSAHVNAIYLIG